MSDTQAPDATVEALREEPKLTAAEIARLENKARALGRTVLPALERDILALIHPFDHPAAHRVFQDLRAALATDSRPDSIDAAWAAVDREVLGPWNEESIEVRRVLAKDGRMLLVVGPFSGPTLTAQLPAQEERPYLFVSTCDWGDCDEPTIAIRHNDGEWLSVCRLHVADATADEVAPIVSSSLRALAPDPQDDGEPA